MLFLIYPYMDLGSSLRIIVRNLQLEHMLCVILFYVRYFGLALPAPSRIFVVRDNSTFADHLLVILLFE